MNFTLSILGGLTLILPGLAALIAVHQQTGRDGARRVDLPLTSTLALAVVMGVSLVSHFVGWALFGLGTAVAQELQAHWKSMDSQWGLTINPYEAAVRLAEGEKATIWEIITFLAIVSIEAVFATAIVYSNGFSLVAGAVDFGNQGWLFQKVILPIRNGLQPVAYVLTTPQGDGSGIAYKGVVVEARQSNDGDLKGLTLTGVEAFGYRIPVHSHTEGGAEHLPALSISTTLRRRLEGVLVLEAAQIRNVLIETIAESTIDDLLEQLSNDPDELASDAETDE